MYAHLNPFWPVAHPFLLPGCITGERGQLPQLRGFHEERTNPVKAIKRHGAFNLRRCFLFTQPSCKERCTAIPATVFGYVKFILKSKWMEMDLEKDIVDELNFCYGKIKFLGTSEMLEHVSFRVQNVNASTNFYQCPWISDSTFKHFFL